MAGMENDEVELARMGYKQELKCVLSDRASKRVNC
jgi:hypothetical protein